MIEVVFVIEDLREVRKRGEVRCVCVCVCVLESKWEISHLKASTGGHIEKSVKNNIKVILFQNNTKL